MFNKKSVITAIITSIAGLFIATTASADVTGPYIGGQIGWGTTRNTDLNNAFGTDDKGDLAGRVYAGFQMNEFFSAEAGYTRFSDVNFNDSGYTQYGYSTLSAQVKTYALDLVAKGSLPLQSGFSVFGKLGVAYVNQYTTAEFNSTTRYTTSSDTTTAALPTFGLGLNYDFTKNVAADVSWMHIQKVGDTSIDSTDTATVGLSYHFG